MDTVDYEYTIDSMYNSRTFFSLLQVSFGDQLPNIDIYIFNLKGALSRYLATL